MSYRHLASHCTLLLLKIKPNKMERIDIKVSEIMKYDRLNSLKWFIHFYLRVKKLLSSCIVYYFGLDSISFSTELKDLNSGFTFPFHKWINRYLRQRSQKKNSLGTMVKLNCAKNSIDRQKERQKCVLWLMNQNAIKRTV